MEATVQPKLKAPDPPTIEPCGPITLATDRDLWERQGSESDKAWGAFVVFRDLPPRERTLPRMYFEITGKRIGQGAAQKVSMHYQRYRARYKWDDRVAAYDRHMDDIWLKELEGQRVRARIETVDLGRALRQKAAEALQELRSVVYVTKTVDGQKVQVPRSSLSATQIVRLAEVGVKLERMALGEDDGEGGLHSLTLVNVEQMNVGDDELLKQAQQIITARARDVTPTDQL